MKMRHESLTTTDGSVLSQGAYILLVSETGRGSVMRLTKDQHKKVIYALGED